MAAHDALEALDIQAGETVLVSGATGGVGSIAIQFAVAAGATVIGTAQPGQEEEYVRGLGAAHTVDYTGDVAAAVEGLAPQGVNKVVHAASDAAALATVVKAGGAIASTIGATAEQVGREAVTVATIMAAATAEKLAALLERVANGELWVNMETAIPLDRAPERSRPSPKAPSARSSSPLSNPRCGSARQAGTGALALHLPGERRERDRVRRHRRRRLPGRRPSSAPAATA